MASYPLIGISQRAAAPRPDPVLRAPVLPAIQIAGAEAGISLSGSKSRAEIYRQVEAMLTALGQAALLRPSAVGLGTSCPALPATARTMPSARPTICRFSSAVPTCGNKGYARCRRCATSRSSRNSPSIISSPKTRRMRASITGRPAGSPGMGARIAVPIKRACRCCRRSRWRMTTATAVVAKALRRGLWRRAGRDLRRRRARR